MNTETFKKDFIDKIREEGFGMTNSGRAAIDNGKYDLDKLFEVVNLDSSMTLKELVLKVIEESKVFNDPGFQFACEICNIGAVLRIYADGE